MKYENRVVCFIDILGFREIIESTIAPDGSEIKKNLSNILLALNRISHMVRDLHLSIAKSKRITQFSDSIVISFRYREESEVFMTLISLQHLLIDLAGRHGVLLRGGISTGKLIHNENLVVGPAMIDAYTLESKVAKFPRIILDKKVLDIARKSRREGHTAREELEYVKSIISQDRDGLYYVDYLAKIYEELDEPELGYPLYLHKISKIIEEGLAHKSGDIREKYVWLRDKYNEVVIPIKKTAKTFSFEDPSAAPAYEALLVF